MKYKDLTNQKFNALLVLERSENKNNKVMWKCRCDCGNITYVLTSSLTLGRTKSCGCYRNNSPIYKGKHHLYKTRLYSIWKGIRKRCNNPNFKYYKNYGGRGITICKEWDNFLSFYNWSVQNGYREDLTIDRINNNGNYEPSNCQWIDIQTQQNNRRNNHQITFNGKTLNLKQWAKLYNINYNSLKNRIRYGLSIEKALTTPIKKR